MHSSEESGPWVVRWRYEMTSKSIRQGIWRLKEGGFFLRIRRKDPRTGTEIAYSRVLHGKSLTIRDAEIARDQLRQEALDRERPMTQSPMLWCEFAASLFEAKANENRLKSAATRQRWADTLGLLVPAFGAFDVHDLRYADLVVWRDRVAGWLRTGMPSRRKADVGKGKITKLAPVTANGWISILKVICKEMTRRFELPRDPAEPLSYFSVGRTYTREQPNALTEKMVPIFLAKMKALYPQHYAMTFLGFITGARPSTLRPIRRTGPEADIDWTDGTLLLRRSNAIGDEIMDQTKTGLDQEIPLPEEAIAVLKEHVAALPDGPMRSSDLLFPSTNGGLRSRSVLDKPFRDVVRTLGWTLRLSPRAMRRTFNDLARKADVRDVVTRAISGHQTEEMQRHYSTAELDEMRSAVAKVISIATARPAAVPTPTTETA